MMFISDRVWERIRDQFTDDEKTTLNALVKGRMLCPAGVEIDADGLEAGLAEKLIEALQSVARAREATGPSLLK